MSDPMYNRAGLDWLVDVQHSNGARWARDEIELLERELKEAHAVVLSLETEAHANHLCAQQAEAQAIAMRGALEELADEVAQTEEHGDGADDPNCSICFAHKKARAALSTDAGRKVLDVVEAAERTLGPGDFEGLRINLRRALAATGK